MVRLSNHYRPKIYCLGKQLPAASLVEKAAPMWTTYLLFAKPEMLLKHCIANKAVTTVKTAALFSPLSHPAKYAATRFSESRIGQGVLKPCSPGSGQLSAAWACWLGRVHKPVHPEAPTGALSNLKLEEVRGFDSLIQQRTSSFNTHSLLVSLEAAASRFSHLVAFFFSFAEWHCWIWHTDSGGWGVGVGVWTVFLAWASVRGCNFWGVSGRNCCFGGEPSVMA
ncbi:hypothetical protein K435DRAFT_796179 [Dendrothele bispora CBS 962.96]|uniref:Uncharacterized protein n=1 Tax=Dendrothele bispora (strain CBS 962.96) TaxID=1314807 RepID=A0A4V6T5H0_DENBC|nr:hypothetical protein K435DRAFT_796179 [Dendrothele bispora CBS 962.96]